MKTLLNLLSSSDTILSCRVFFLQCKISCTGVNSFDVFFQDLPPLVRKPEDACDLSERTVVMTAGSVGWVVVFLNSFFGSEIYLEDSIL